MTDHEQETPRCDVELIDTTGDGSDGVLLVRRCRINGHDVYVPSGTEFAVKGGDRIGVELSLRVFPTSLVIRGGEA